MLTLGRGRGVLALLFCAVLLFCACAGGGANSLPPIEVPEAETAPAASSSTEAVVALVTTESRYDTAFGQAVWQAVNRFVGEQGLHGAVYKAEDGDEEAALATLGLAAEGGAQLVVSMGESASAACAAAGGLYPGIEFILFDLPAGAPEPGRAVWVAADALSTGWVAGYTAVQSGMTDLVCLWDESEDGLAEGRQYALGFILGCQDAAKERAAGDEAVRVRVLGLTGEDEAADTAAARQLLEQHPQLVLNCFVGWSGVSAWFEGISGTRLLAPLCQKDVPAGRLWALVELEPGEIVAGLLEAWQNDALDAGRHEAALTDDGGARLAAGLTGGAQEALDETAAYLGLGNRLALVRHTAAVQSDLFPDLAAVDFPDLNLMMLPRDNAPQDTSGGAGNGANSGSGSDASASAGASPGPGPADADPGAQAAPPAEAQSTPAPSPEPTAPTEGPDAPESGTPQPEE